MSCLFLVTPLFTMTVTDMEVVLLSMSATPFLLRHLSIELLLVELKLKHQCIMAGVFYRPPSSDLSVLCELEELPLSKTKKLVLLGDFNIDLLSATPDLLLSSIIYKIKLTLHTYLSSSHIQPLSSFLQYTDQTTQTF